MKLSLKLLCLFLSIQLYTPAFADWEIISSNPRITNLETMGDTWYAIEYHGTTSAGIFLRSNDYGNNWDTVPGFSDIFMIRIQQNKIIARGTYNGSLGFYVSSDFAKTWTKLFWPFSGGAMDMLINDSAIFVHVSKSSEVTSPVYRSIDDGKSWQPMPVETGDVNWNWSYEGLTFGKYGNTIGAFIASSGFFISQDGGATWIKKNEGLPPITTGAPLSVSYDGFSICYENKWYKFNGNNWYSVSYEFFSYDSGTDDWIKTTGVSPNIRSSRVPYLAAVDGESMGYLYYSIDNGKKWFRFSDATGFTSVFATSVIIKGNYIYAGFVNGFARRSLNEAVNHDLKAEMDESVNNAVSPEEMNNLLNLLGADGLEELLDNTGIDSDELTAEEIRDFLNDYQDTYQPSDLFGNSQPGTCNYMGMPVWSMNVANLKLFIRDVLFRKKGIGPEMKLAMNFVNSADSSAGIFGRAWRFEYESQLEQLDSSVIMTSGTGAVFIFSKNTPVITGLTSFSLPCVNNNRYNLHWTGSAWRVEKGKGFEFLNFVNQSPNLFVLGSVEDSYGKKVTLFYDTEFRPVKIQDGTGREYILTYSGNLCSSIVLPDSRSASFIYNSRNLLISSTDLEGIESKYTYDRLRNITEVEIAGKTTSFAYNYNQDLTGKTSTVIDPEERRTEYYSTWIDSVNYLTNIVYPDNNFITYQVNNGMVTSITNQAGDSKKIFYNEKGQPVSFLWYDGSVENFTYDASGNLITKKDIDGKITSYEYNANRKLTAARDESGTILFKRNYNTKNQITGTDLQNGLVLEYFYDNNGALSLVKEGDNLLTFGRDAYGNLVSYTNAAGNTMNIQYSPEGLTPVGLSDFNGNSYDFNYDGNGRLKEITMPDGNSRMYNFDCCAQTGITDENGNTVTVNRDATNRITEKFSAEGVSLPVHYDASGFVSGYRNIYGSEKSLKYNSRGLLAMVSDEEGDIQYGYDPGGRVVSVIDKKGNETRLTYNELHELSEIIDAAGNRTVFAFDSGRLNSYTNARRQTTHFGYNEKGLVTRKSLNTDQYVFYQHNGSNELISYTDSSGITLYTRNALGFVTKILYPNGLFVEFTHDANGNITETAYPNGLVVYNTPDEMNRIVKLEWNNMSVDFQYDPAGNLLSEFRSNETSSQYTYNKDNILTGLSHRQADQEFCGERVQIENGIIAGSEVKVVPEINIVPAGLPNMAYNNLNQPVRSVYNNLDFTHDADGNLTLFTDHDLVRLAASYSHENLISSMKTESGSVRVSFDAMRYPRKLEANGVITYLHYDHKSRLLFETDPSGNTIRIYIYKGNRLIACQAANEAYFYHYNRVGNTLAMTDSDGNIVNSYAYSAQGETIGKEEIIDNRFTFLGAFGALKLQDNYILTGSRVYSTQMGRYLQRDPLGIITGTNPYLYASNNPISGVDPLGLDEQKETINSQNLDPSTDNDYSTAGGSANPYADDLPYRNNDWDTYGSALTNTLEEFSNHPVSDFLPDFMANPTSFYKAIDKLANKEYGKALWQFIPFNNSMEAAGDYIQEKVKYVDPRKSSGLGIFGEFTNQKTFSCDM